MRTGAGIVAQGDLTYETIQRVKRGGGGGRENIRMRMGAGIVASGFREHDKGVVPVSTSTEVITRAPGSKMSPTVCAPPSASKAWPAPLPLPG